MNVRQKIVLYDLFVREEYRRIGFAKLLIAIGEGKKKYDKRQIKKEKEWKRQKKLI